MSDDLLARADAVAETLDIGYPYYGAPETVRDLAAALREAREEIERLRRERDIFRGTPADDRLLLIAAKAERDRANADAARYRWLRKQHGEIDPKAHVVWNQYHGIYGEAQWVNTAGPTQLDAAIDTALRGEGEGGEQ